MEPIVKVKVDFSKPIQVSRSPLCGGGWEDVAHFCFSDDIAFMPRNQVYYRVHSDGSVSGACALRIRNKPPEPVVHRRWVAWVRNRGKVYACTYHTEAAARNTSGTLLHVEEIVYVEQG